MGGILGIDARSWDKSLAKEEAEDDGEEEGGYPKPGRRDWRWQGQAPGAGSAQGAKRPSMTIQDRKQ